MPEPSDYFSEIQSILAELELDAVLIGALAAVRYRLQPRATTDVDFLARRLDGLAERMTASQRGPQVAAAWAAPSWSE